MAWVGSPLDGQETSNIWVASLPVPSNKQPAPET